VLLLYERQAGTSNKSCAIPDVADRWTGKYFRALYVIVKWQSASNRNIYWTDYFFVVVSMTAVFCGLITLVNKILAHERFIVFLT